MPQKLVTLPSIASVDDVCEVIQRDGGVIVEDMPTSSPTWTAPRMVPMASPATAHAAPQR